MKRLTILILLLALLLALALTLPGCRKPEPEEAVPNPVATITMSDGSVMRFELRPDMAPNTVANFVDLANRNFFAGQQFFRVISGAFIQGGDPRNDGTGDPGYAIRGEFADNGWPENTLTHARGTLSMARQRDYDSAGSQFFIMHYNYPEYDGQYAAFGTILDDESLATLDAIAAQPVDGSYVPLTRQVIASITVETYGREFEPVTIDRKQ